MSTGEYQRTSKNIPFHILTVNSLRGDVFGERAEHPLSEIDSPVEVVEVFRIAHEGPEIAREAIAIGAKVLWIQGGSYQRKRGK